MAPEIYHLHPLVVGHLSDWQRHLSHCRDMGFDVVCVAPPFVPDSSGDDEMRSLVGIPDPVTVLLRTDAADARAASRVVHRELGALEDLRTLIAAARDNGLEIALGFAVQCSPDHPWLHDHPDWFCCRADGSIRFAKNPPKRYEDIANSDCYADTALPALSRVLRDMVFLAEPFTRPKVMYRLAEIGLTQSYTCVTWRHTIGEITGHLMELNAVPAHEFARPNLFVNTPNSNPPYLQASDRPGCLIRVALACTPHGLWGMYSGFEICELEPLPGHEEYHDSEKYQMRLRDFSAPGNITAEIAGLNRICRVRPDDGALAATNLMHGHSFIWQDRSQRIRLDPAELPSAIWQVMPPRGFQ